MVTTAGTGRINTTGNTSIAFGAATTNTVSNGGVIVVGGAARGAVGADPKPVRRSRLTDSGLIDLSEGRAGHGSAQRGHHRLYRRGHGRAPVIDTKVDLAGPPGGSMARWPTP